VFIFGKKNSNTFSPSVNTMSSRRINHTAYLIGGLLFIGGLIAAIVITAESQKSWTTEPESNDVAGNSRNYQTRVACDGISLLAKFSYYNR
jgi:hypothetical protein